MTDFKHVGDFNGDGLTDIIGRAKETGEWWLGIALKGTTNPL